MGDQDMIEDTQLRELWADATISLVEVRRRSGYGEKRFRRKVQELGLGPRPEKRHRHADTIEKMFPDHKIAEIAAKVQMTPEAVNHVCAQLGLKRGKRLPQNRAGISDEAKLVLELWPTMWPADIARRMGKSRNAVFNLAKRLAKRGLLNLQRAQPLSRPKPVLVKPRAAPRRNSMLVRDGKLRAPTIVDLAAVKPHRELPNDRRFVGRVRDCTWPEGEPRTPEFKYCDAPTLPGESYCEFHWRCAWKRVA